MNLEKLKNLFTKPNKKQLLFGIIPYLIIGILVFVVLMFLLTVVRIIFPPAPAAISVSPASQDFGSVVVNTSAERTFTVSNIGDKTLLGTASVSVPFSCVAGCDYSIATGGSHTVTIRFTPTTAGDVLGTVSFTGGGGTSATVSGTGEATISIAPASQDFGSIVIDISAERRFTVSNIGEETLSGTASVSAPFFCVAGCDYSIAAGGSHTVTIRFTPTAEGAVSGTVSFTGGGGASATVTGIGVATIFITPVFQDFGSMTVNTSDYRTFTVRNIGGGILSGTASVSAPFYCHAGCAYSIAAGGSHTVTIRFTPTVSGAISGTVSFTGGGGASSTVTGIGVAPPAISVTPSSQDFERVAVNTSAERTFIVRNIGDRTLSGTASVSAPFFCVAGCDYSIAAGGSHTVTIRFTSTAAGAVSDRVYFTGGGGARTTVTGIGVATISVTPASQDFGNVTVKTSTERTFIVRNIGGGTLSGIASVSIPFFCVAGCDYNIVAGGSHTVTIRFTPTAIGAVSGTVYFTGGGGTRATVRGTGVRR